MSFRRILASALCLAIVAGSIALYFAQPILSVIAVVFAVAGWLTAMLLRRDATRNRTSTETNADAGVGRAAVARGAAAGGLGGGVPAGEMLEAMLGSVREGLVVVDGGMRVVALNASARAIFGAGEAASTSRSDEDAGDALQAGELRALGELTRHPAVLGAFAEALAHGRQVGAKIETDARERRAYDLRVAPLKSRDGWGARHGAVGVFFDITRLERLERVRQEFLLNVSHELRTPLTAIRTFVETLAAGVVDEPENNRRFLSIEPQPLALRPLVQDVLTSLAGRAAERNVALHNEVAEDVTLRADARRLEQMLTNLADNAVKFSREGGEVRVSHERDARRDRISVSDTGEGIAPEHIARIFERFYRVDRARSRALGGTGLGLAIVKHLARAHGGEARVSSTVGEGTIFTVELPREESDELEMMNDER
jgi:two-component system phosphate regulon sensor histidine kinase PhoR